MTSRLAALCLLAAVPVCGQELQLFEAVEPHMGTLVRIQVYAESAARAQAGFHAAFERIAQLDAALSDYREDSEVNRLCRAPAGQPVALSSDLYAVLSAAMRLAEETDGAFDPALGTLTSLWRAARRQGHVPERGALDEAAKHAGYRHLHLDPAAHTATLDVVGMRLDLGGIGKGYAADAALAALAALGMPRALVAASGDLAIGDAPPGRTGWRVGIDSPGTELARVLTLANAAVSTSGDSSQRLETAGGTYSHILDPRTGMGLTRRVTVSVLARRGVDADSWSTALSVLGAARGIELLRKHPGISALFTTEGGCIESAGWPGRGTEAHTQAR